MRVEALALGRRSLVTPGQSCETHGQVLALVDGEDRPRFVAAERVLDAAPAPAGAPPPPPNDQTPPAAASGPQTGASAPEETDRWP